VVSGVCEVVREFAGIAQPCHGKYGLSDEDVGNYSVGWRPLDSNVSLPEYTYRTSDELDSYPFWGSHAVYSGGGYVVEMRGTVREMAANVRRLEADRWIDHQTRAVFIELTVYNAQVRVYSVLLKLLFFVFFFLSFFVIIFLFIISFLLICSFFFSSIPFSIVVWSYNFSSLCTVFLHLCPLMISAASFYCFTLLIMLFFFLDVVYILFLLFFFLPFLTIREM